MPDNPPDILFIKTSSLGDVIHHMPAVTDARRHGVGRIAWLVEEDCVPLVRLHPAVDDVIAVASRRWRREGWSAGVVAGMAAFRRDLRARSFARVIDTQGLIRTGLMARFARGQRHGYDQASIREPLASLFYDVRHRVSKQLHAVERNRRLTGLALGYEPQGAVDYGLDRNALRRGGAPYALLLHATARAEKQWPVAHWIALGNLLAGRNVNVVLPWGSNDERLRAEQIAAQVPRARVADRQPLDGVARLMADAEFVVGVDTGILHLAAALRVPLVGIYCETLPELTGPVGQGPIGIVGTRGQVPSVDDVMSALVKIVP